MNRINRIKTAELFLVRLPLVRPFETSFSIQKVREALLVKLTSDNSYGWGECVTGVHPFYSYETNRTACHIISDYLIPLVFSLRNFFIEDALNEFSHIQGHFMAKAAVENALFDLLSREQNLPLYTLIGGTYKKIRSGISLGIEQNTDELLRLTEEAVKKKYHRIKIKVKKGRDIRVLKILRKHFPELPLMADANGDYQETDLQLLKQFDEFNLMMLEQPLGNNDLYFHSLIQKELKTPICLDESIQSLNDLRTALALESCRIINIKQARVGGIKAAKIMQSYCLQHNIKVWSGGMLETGIGRNFNLHLQTLPGFTLPGDTSETSRYFHEDIVDTPIVLQSDGFIEIPPGPGIGAEVIPKRLNKYKIMYKKF
ncbi:MAG: o-succinylbenzoate synthase [bacterium]